MGLACLKGAGRWSGDPACLWIPGLTGLGDAMEQFEILCVWVPSSRSCVCGSLAWQALGAQPCRVTIVQCCAGFGGVAGKAEIIQDWGPWPSETELLQGCASLGSVAGKAEILQSWGAWPSEAELLQGYAGL
jgi:hypothetical protein